MPRQTLTTVNTMEDTRQQLVAESEEKPVVRAETRAHEHRSAFVYVPAQCRHMCNVDLWVLC